MVAISALRRDFFRHVRALARWRRRGDGDRAPDSAYDRAPDSACDGALDRAPDSACERDRVPAVDAAAQEFAGAGVEAADRAETANTQAADAGLRHLAMLPEVCAILKEHARNVITDTEQASYGFVDGLTEIDDKINRLKSVIAESHRSIDAMDAGSSESAERNLALIADIKSSFESNVGLVRKIIAEREEFTRMIDTMRRLHNELQVIDQIARKVKLLSLNASIEAAQAADFGAGFAVIAQEIRELSDQSQGATRTLAPLIETAHRSVEAIAADQGIESGLRDQLGLLETMQSHLVTVTDTYAAMLDQQRKVTEATEQQSVGIEQAIRRSLAELQFQDIVRQQLEPIVAALDSLQQTLGAAVAGGAADGAAIEGLVDELRQRYVMSRQRNADAKAVGGSDAEAGSAIELF
jgi:methyl-accepting chemotaxis protein